MKIDKIQQILNQAKKDVEHLTPHQMALRVVNASRKNDAQFRANCSKAQQNEALRKHKAEKQRLVRSKPFMAGPYGKFSSKSEFDKSPEATKLSINGDDKMHELPHLYYYIKDGPGKSLKQIVVYTPYGSGPRRAGRESAMTRLFELAKKAKDPYATSHSASEWFNKMKKKDPDNYYEREEVKQEWCVYPNRIRTNEV